MLTAYAQHGKVDKALELFNQMVAHAQPDESTFINLLNACSHGKLADMSLSVLNSMKTKYCITPTIQHHTCVVDALARSKRLAEAEQYLATINPNVVTLKTLLSACRTHRDAERAERIAGQALAIDPSDPAIYVLLGNTYALTGNYDKAKSIRTLMDSRGIKKQPGQTFIHGEDGQVHSFVVQDTAHPLSKRIYDHLSGVIERLKKVGYKPNTSLVMQNIEEIEKEQLVCGHR